MKRTLLVLVAALFLLAPGCDRGSKAARPIDAQETYGMLLNDFAWLVDVREPTEMKEGVAAQARLIPLAKIRAGDEQWKSFVKSVPTGKQVVFYGSSEPQGREAAESAAREGLTARSLRDYSEWTAAKLPTRKP